MPRANWWTDAFRALEVKNKAADERRKRLLAEIAEGIYEDVETKPTSGAQKPKGVGMTLRPTPGKQRADDQLE